MSEPECLYEDITQLVNSDGSLVCFNPTARLLSVGVSAQVTIDPEAYCRPNPDPACEGQLPPPTFLDYGDQLQILPEGDPSAITISVTNSHPDTTVPTPYNPDFPLHYPVIGALAVAALVGLLKRFPRPPRFRPARRTFRRDPPLTPPGALYRSPQTPQTPPVSDTPKPKAHSEPDTNLVYTTPLPASIKYSTGNGPFSYIDNLYSQNKTRRVWAVLNRRAEFKKKGQQEGWW